MQPQDARIGVLVFELCMDSSFLTMTDKRKTSEVLTTSEVFLIGAKDILGGSRVNNEGNLLFL